MAPPGPFQLDECSALTNDTVKPPQSTVPPWLPELTFSTPWLPAQSPTSAEPTSIAPLALQIATASPVWSLCPCVTSTCVAPVAASLGSPLKAGLPVRNGSI